MKASDLIKDAWLKISADDPLYRDQWITDETWYRAINKHYPTIQTAIKFDRQALNRALVRLSGRFDASNISGIYHTKFSTICPYENKKRSVSYYFRQVHSKPPAQPSAASDVEDVIANSIRVQLNRVRISPTEKEKRENDEVSKAIKVTKEEAEKKEQQSNERKKKEQQKGGDEGGADSTEENRTEEGPGAKESDDGGDGGSSDGGDDLLSKKKAEEKDGYLGPFHDPANPDMVKVGEKQLLNWEGDLRPYEGPWYLSQEERLKQKDDQPMPLPLRKLTREELIDEIKKKDSEGSMGN